MKISQNIFIILLATSSFTTHINSNQSHKNRPALIKKLKKAWQNNWVKAGTITATCAILYALGVKLNIIAPAALICTGTKNCTMCLDTTIKVIDLLKKDNELKTEKYKYDIENTNSPEERAALKKSYTEIIDQNNKTIQKHTDHIQRTQARIASNNNQFLWKVLGVTGGLGACICGYAYFNAQNDDNEDLTTTEDDSPEIEFSDDFFEFTDEQIGETPANTTDAEQIIAAPEVAPASDEYTTQTSNEEVVELFDEINTTNLPESKSAKSFLTNTSIE